MEWHSVVRPHVSKALGECDLSREALLMVLFALHHTLPEQAERFRKTRAPDQPDSFFLFRASIFDGAVRSRMAFWVDDVTAPGYLFVENLTHQLGSIDP